MEDENQIENTSAPDVDVNTTPETKPVLKPPDKYECARLRKLVKEGTPDQRYVQIAKSGGSTFITKTEYDSNVDKYRPLAEKIANKNSASKPAAKPTPTPAPIPKKTNDDEEINELWSALQLEKSKRKKLKTKIRNIKRDIYTYDHPASEEPEQPIEEPIQQPQQPIKHQNNSTVTGPKYPIRRR